MAYRTRIYYSEKQKEEMWDRWQKGESIASIGRSFLNNYIGWVQKLKYIQFPV